MVYKKITRADIRRTRRRKQKLLSKAIALTVLVGFMALFVVIPKAKPDPHYTFESLVYGSMSPDHYTVEDEYCDGMSALYTIGSGDYQEGDKVRVTMEYGQIADVEKIGGESVCH